MMIIKFNNSKFSFIKTLNLESVRHADRCLMFK